MKFRVTLAVFVYAVAANIPLWVASRFLGVSINGLLNIEFIAIGILSFLVSRWLTAVLLAGAIGLDLAYSIGKTYMLTPGELAASASSALLFFSFHKWAMVALVFSIVTVAFLFTVTACTSVGGNERKLTVSLLVAIACVSVSVDYSRGEIAAFNYDSQQGRLRMIRNSVHRLIVDEEILRELRKSSSGAAVAMIGASVPLMKLASMEGGSGGRGAAPNIVFVVVESWGRPRAEEVQALLLAPYMQPELSRSYTVTSGTTPFRGATVSGEMRELCGSSLGLGVMAAPASALQNCLPERFKRIGYHTVAVHGFEGAMFERTTWYKKMQFEEIWFKHQLAEQGLTECPGPFPGICDTAVGTWIGDRLQRDAGSPQFIYWMTLNSHLPVPVSNGVKDPPSCSGVAELADEAVCAWYRLIFNVHRSVAELAERQAARPTVFVVVGDHAPPFSSERRRKEFSSEVVPYVMLWPKDVSGGGMPPPTSFATGRAPSHPRERTPLREGRRVSHPHGNGL